MNKNTILKIDYVKFFDNINSYTSFERKRILSDLTNGFDLNLLTEFSNSFVQYCFLKFNDVNNSLPYIKPIEAEAGAIRLNEIHFPFYEFVKNEIYKEVSIEVFNNINWEQIIQFNKTLDFLDEIETIIENQNIKIIGTTPEAVKLDEVKKELHNDIFKYNAFEVFEFYKEKKQINVNSRTDLRVIFELLKSDNLLLETIELKHYINWLNRVYYNGDITELKKQNLNSKPNIIRTNDYNDYKKATLKQP